MTLRALPGLLILSGTPNAALTVTGVGGNLFKVADGAKSFGNYKINSLHVNLNFYTAPITLDLNTQKIGGNILINRGNGFLGALPNTTNPIEIRDGAVGGSITMTGGRGNEIVNLGANAGVETLSVGGNVTVVGRNGAVGDGDDFRLRAGSGVGGNLTLVGTPAIAVGEPGLLGSKVGGNLTVNAITSNRELNLSLNGPSVIGKTASILGTNVSTPNVGGDSIFVEGGANGATVGGNFYGDLANRDNFWLLGGTFNGDVFLRGGDGTSPLPGVLPVNAIVLDNFAAGTEAQIAGSLNAYMGNGDTVMIFNAAASVAGDLLLSCGNGNNDIGGGPFGGVFAGSVAGDTRISLGNGTNTVTIENAPSGALYLSVGNGNNAVTLGTLTSLAANWRVDVSFGTGTNLFTLADTGANSQTISGKVRGLGQDDTFTQDVADWSIISPFVITI